MIQRPIIPRLLTVKSRQFWRVHVPAGIRKHQKTKTRDFKTPDAAEKFAEELRKLQRPFDAINALHDCLTELGRDPLVQRCVSLHQAAALDSRQNLPFFIAKFLESKTNAGVRANSMAALKCSLDSFAKEFAHLPASAITAQDIDGWLASHPDWQPRTRKGRVVDLKNFFNWCLKRQIVARNPALAVEMPRLAYRPPPILTVEEIERLLRAAEQADPALTIYFALILFGGLRPKEAERTTAECVHDGMVDISGDKTKNNTLRRFAIQPTLAAWLGASPVFGWPNLYKRINRVKAAAGVKIEHDALRHSAASYFYQILGQRATAEMMGHSEGILKRHYAAQVSKANAERFIALRPATSNEQIQ